MDICRNGGYAAILDMNEELASELVKEIGGGKTKFFETNVLETESIAAAVKGTLEWVKETGKEIGGVIAAAGVSTPAKVCHFFPVLTSTSHKHIVFEVELEQVLILLTIFDPYNVTLFSLCYDRPSLSFHPIIISSPLYLTNRNYPTKQLTNPRSSTAT